ncbi:hypothetical protein ASG37_09875 [Sphingomonas sp. Leaf407]|uniref:hypothetical protein n=1 Tax=unclassified Sphingomonas TaxID=196159 RepID=UPI0006F88834|nr:MULTISPECIES: hypothetical protein [unclassified Sphingomonas]KQN37361.1 hypothetical protein ASE97_07165 [Sphingomonas sp. Leaf42]KQT27730.1 hypothetical protein ASG37_09875 [Sphingomonas sp. Leaf407]
MVRPASIVRFDRFYLLAIVVGLIGTILQWPQLMAMIETDPSFAPVRSAGVVLAAIFAGAGVLISLLLWYLVARRGSTVAKWIVTAFTALSLGSLLLGISSGSVASDTTGILRMVAVVLQLIAVIALFRRDARPWFNRAYPEDLA